MPLLNPSTQLVIIDEIGKMECLSEKFRDFVQLLLNVPAPVIATIAMKAGGFINEIKHRPDVGLYQLTERNLFDRLVSEIIDVVRSL